MYFNFPQLSSSFLLILHSEGLAVGMEDIDVGNEGDANGDVDDKDDAELCYTKHTGNQQHELLVACWKPGEKKADPVRSGKVANFNWHKVHKNVGKQKEVHVHVEARERAGPFSY